MLATNAQPCFNTGQALTGAQSVSKQAEQRVSELEGLLKAQEQNSKQELLQQREQHTEVVCLAYGDVCGWTFRFPNTKLRVSPVALSPEYRQPATPVGVRRNPTRESMYMYVYVYVYVCVPF